MIIMLLKNLDRFLIYSPVMVRKLSRPFIISFVWMLGILLTVPTFAGTDALANTDSSKNVLSGENNKLKLSSSEESADKKIYNLDGESYLYTRPTFGEFFREIPKQFGRFFTTAFSRDSIIPWAGIISSTALLFMYDQEITNEVQRFGRKIGIGNTDRTKTMVTFRGKIIFRGPTEKGSAMLFVADGWTQAALISGFLIYGASKNDIRASRTASHLALGLLTEVSLIQVLKRSIGRQDPVASTGPRGHINPFPSFKEYSKHTTSYDAFPSGHMATGVMAFTVITENYPEYPLIKPIGYTLLTLLGFQLMNCGVHWISDYPLAIGIGYLSAKVATLSGRTLVKNKDNGPAQSFSITPLFNIKDHNMGFSFSYRF